MNENINLCEILKYCPEGTEFWSPVLGKCEYRGINVGRIRMFVRDMEIFEFFDPDGILNWGAGLKSAECMLFPSKEQRDWSKWKCPKPKKPKFDPKTLNPFDKVLTKYDGGCWSANLFSHIEERDNEYCAPFSVCNGSLVKLCIPYNEETKHLVGTSDEAPEYYRYWED